MEIYYRLSVMREKTVLQQYASRLDGVFVDAHVLETFSNSIPAFLSSNLIPHIIDPVLYKFQAQTVDQYVDKRWFNLLVNELGLWDLLSVSGHLGPRDLLEGTEGPRAERLVRDVLRYERNRVERSAGPAGAFLTILEERIPFGSDLKFLMSPYLVSQDLEDHRANLLLAQKASLLSGDLPLFIPVALDRDLLYSPQQLESLAGDFGQLEGDGYLVWVTGFREWKEDGPLLEIFADLVMQLKGTGRNKRVINLFGGFYSTALAAKGVLDGVVQGVGISEARDPVTIGGQAPMRYYLPSGHQMLVPRTVDELRALDAELFGCLCNVCQRTTAALRLSQSELMEHAVQTRLDETESLSSMSSQEIVADLTQKAQAIASVPSPVPKNRTLSQLSRRLQVWADALENVFQTYEIG